MGMSRRLFGGLCIALLTALLTPPTAQARVGLSPGMKLYIGDSSCSLGFLATNADDDRLAVTAGHCATGADQVVLSPNGNRVGVVAFWMPDDLPNGRFGVTVIQRSKNTYISDAYFVVHGNPKVGDYVRKYGARTEKTEGRITKISNDLEYPRYSRMEATLVNLPGDSGSAWVGSSEDGPKLLGLNVGFTKRNDGGYGFALGFPIRSLIALVKAKSKNWGTGFIPVGP